MRAVGTGWDMCLCGAPHQLTLFYLSNKKEERKELMRWKGEVYTNNLKRVANEAGKEGAYATSRGLVIIISD